MRVLCLGAYSNGNVGDMYQADAIAFAIRELDPSVEVFSLSPSRRGSDYDASAHTAVSADRLYDAEFLNGFELILVGGGGLLASPHHPLPDVEWVRLLRSPVCALGVGVAAKHAAESAAFVDVCTLFSVRDEYSLAGVKAMRPDAEIVMDPILLAPTSFHQMSRPPGEKGIVWVPGKLVKETSTFYAKLYLEVFDHRNDWIISFNEVTDRGSGFEDIFGDRVRYIHTIEEFHEACAGGRFVVSERYHGCILAIRAGVPCLGAALRSDIVTSKITELYRRMGIVDGIVTMDSKWSRSSLRARTDGQDPAANRRYLEVARQGYMSFLSRCLDVGRGAESKRT